MGIISGFKNIVKNALGVEQLKKQTQGLKDLAADVFKTEKSTRKESFEAALVRLNLTETDIQKRASEFRRLALIFSMLAIALVIYLFYMVSQKALVASLGTLGILLVVLGQLFRCHFWLYQIRCRKLGCTFKDWFKQSIGLKV